MEVSGPDVRIVQGVRGELPLFEDPPRPALVQVGGPTLIEADPWGLEHQLPVAAGGRPPRGHCPHVQAELRREGLDPRARHEGHADLGPRAPAFERHSRALLEQAVDGEGRVRSPVVEEEARAAAVHAARQQGDVGQPGELGVRRHGLFHEDDVGPHEHAERPGRDVIGGFRGRGRRAADLRVGLPLQQVLGVPGKHLGQGHDQRTFLVASAVGLEGVSGAPDLDTAQLELLGQPHGGSRIELAPDGDQDGTLVAVLDRDPVDLVDLPEQRLALISGGFEQAHGRNQFVVDDVAERPSATHPGPRVFGTRRDVTRWRQRSAGRVGGAPALRAVGFGRDGGARRRPTLLEGGRDAGARHLGEEPDLVVPPAAPRHRAFPEVRVGGVVDDPVFARCLERGRLRLAEDPVPPVDQRVDVGVDGVGRGHDEDPGAGTALLMLVEPDGREPVVPEQPCGELALLLGEHVHVAVVVVPDVGVVEPGHRAPVKLGAEVLVEPVDHHDLAVGIQARHEDEDDVVQDLAHARRVVGGQAVHQVEHHLRGADLGRVDVARHQDDELGGTEDLVALGRRRDAALEVEPTLELLDPVDVSQRVRRADLDGDEAVASGRLPQFADPDARRALGHRLQVGDDLVPAGQLVVGADREAEELLRRRNGGGELSRHAAGLEPLPGRVKREAEAEQGDDRKAADAHRRVLSGTAGA